MDKLQSVTDKYGGAPGRLSWPPIKGRRKLADGSNRCSYDYHTKPLERVWRIFEPGFDQLILQSEVKSSVWLVMVAA